MKTINIALIIAASFFMGSTQVHAAPFYVEIQNLQAASIFPDTDIQAKGRTGSKRVGGYTKNGKGSRYIGGRR